MSSWGIRLGTRTSWLVQVVCWTAILSGLFWIGLGWGLDPQDFFHPLRGWRHRLLVLHGVSAYMLLWVIGSLFTLHQMGNWRARRNRASGLTMTSALLLLALSGLTLYYPPHEDWRDTFSLFHQVLGAPTALLVLVHIWAGKISHRMRRLASSASSQNVS